MILVRLAISYACGYTLMFSALVVLLGVFAEKTFGIRLTGLGVLALSLVGGVLLTHYLRKGAPSRYWTVTTLLAVIFASPLFSAFLLPQEVEVASTRFAFGFVVGATLATLAVAFDD